MQPILEKNKILRGFNRTQDDARKAVYQLYHDALFIMIRKITGDSPDAEDLVNDSFRVLYEGERNFEEISLIRDFLFRTGQNISINYLKRQERTQTKYAEFQELHAYDDDDFYADITYSETRALIFKSIEELPEKHKAVFRLRYFEDLSNEEVADRLNISLKTVYNRYSEARQKLRWEWEKVKNFTLYLLNLFI